MSSVWLADVGGGAGGHQAAGHRRERAQGPPGRVGARLVGVEEQLDGERLGLDRVELHLRRAPGGTAVPGERLGLPVGPAGPADLAGVEQRLDRAELPPGRAARSGW